MSVNIGCNIVDPRCDEPENYVKAVYLEQVAEYRRYGFSHLEFSHVLMLSEDDAKAIKDLALTLGMIPWSIHSEHLNAPGPAALAEYLATQERCAKVAAALGTFVMVCHIPNVEPRAGDMKRDLEVLARVADITGAHGLTLAIETHPCDYIIEVVDRLDRPDVGMNLDTGHSYLYDGGDVAAVARKIGKRLKTLHLQDNFGTNDDHQPPGLGKIDWHATLSAIKGTGYQGPLMLEMTGGGVKSRRADAFLKEFPQDKELVFAKAYLEHVWERINEGDEKRPVPSSI